MYKAKTNFLKKTIQIAFTSVFMVLTIGFTVHKHYSHGELFSLAIFSEPESCCPGGMCDCCNEKSETIQFLATYATSLDHVDCTPIQIDLLQHVLLFSLQEPEIVFVKKEVADQDLPPPDNLTRLSCIQTFLL